VEKILVIEDERDVAEALRYNLERAGFAVNCSHDGASGLRQALGLKPSLVVLDLMLPGMNGLEVCRELRAHPAGLGIPVLMLTAKAEESDKVAGLEVGADDYMTKPFSMRELVARVRALLRRASQAAVASQAFSFPGLEVDQASHEVRVAGRPVALTPREFKLLTFFCERQGKLVTREALLAEVWDSAVEVETRTVDVHILRLRDKLGAAGKLIGTVRGFGYRFKPS
jgi:two-component system phosphate regulon response regulator PhoB